MILGLLVGTGVCVVSTGISLPSTKCQPLGFPGLAISVGAHELWSKQELDNLIFLYAVTVRLLVRLWTVTLAY